jgi:hypothetical protein
MIAYTWERAIFRQPAILFLFQPSAHSRTTVQRA